MTLAIRMCCIVSNFYIKSQRFIVFTVNDFRCIVSNFYIKSQRFIVFTVNDFRCIVSNFYIKSQRLYRSAVGHRVV